MVETSKTAFAARLRQVCDGQGVPERGRRLVLARLVGVSGEAARKWLSGDTIPAMEHVATLASHFNIRADWLLSGTGPRDVDEVGSLTDEERAHIERLRCLPPSERARVFRVVDALVSPELPESASK